jgi:hypothetical protein
VWVPVLPVGQPEGYVLFLLFSLLQNPCFKGAGCQGFVNPGISRIFFNHKPKK